MSYHTEILEKLSNRTIDYFEQDLGLGDGLDREYKIVSVENIDYHDRTVFISLTGDIKGTVGMSVTNQLSFDIAKAFVFGEMDDEELLELSSESVSEVLNVTLGNILNDINIIKNGGKVEISTPLPMAGSMNIKRKKNGQMFIVNLKHKDSVIILSYFI